MPSKTAKTEVGANEVQEKGSKVAAVANLRDVRLFKTSAELKGIPSGDEPLSWNLQVTPNADYTTGDGYFTVMLSFEADIEVASEVDTHEESTEEEPSDEIAKISFAFGVLYELDSQRLDQGFEAEEVDEFARSTAVLALYPYAREYIHDITMRLGLPPLVVNTFKPPQLADKPGNKKRKSSRAGLAPKVSSITSISREA